MDLSTYDLILLNSSGGKDSQTMLDVVAASASAGLRARMTVIHCDLGRVEWRGSRELAEKQARHYGIRFIAIARPQGDLLQHVEERGMWPSSTARYCTSDHKRGQAAVVMTRLVSEWHAKGHASPCRVLECLGFRADESSARAKRKPFSRNARATNGKRMVDTWLPIHQWSLAQVWASIKASGVPYHFAYDLGMPRLSCCFCIFAPKAALVLAARHNPELLEDYIGVERRTGHQFKKDLSLIEIQTAARNDSEPVGPISSWCM